MMHICMHFCVLVRVHVQVFSVDLEEAEDISGEFENNGIRGCNAGMHLSSFFFIRSRAQSS